MGVMTCLRERAARGKPDHEYSALERHDGLGQEVHLASGAWSGQTIICTIAAQKGAYGCHLAPLREVVNVIPRIGGPPARQAPVGDWWVEVPVAYRGPMKESHKGTRREARKARQEKARLTRERKARK
jgi:hypothetical protein